MISITVIIINILFICIFVYCYKKKVGISFFMGSVGVLRTEHPVRYWFYWILIFFLIFSINFLYSDYYYIFLNYLSLKYYNTPYLS
jgi:hypothetical protein